MTPTNQKQQALWYLMNWDSFSLLEVINHSMFYKFQSRLSEIENEHGSITDKSKRKFVNTFGRKSDYVVYRCKDKQKAEELFKNYA